MTSANGPEPGTRTRNPLCGTRPPNRSSNASPATAPPSIIRRPPDGQNTNITTLQPDRTLVDHFHEHPDAEIYRSLPGLGDVLGARVLAEFGDDPNRYHDARVRMYFTPTPP